MNDNMQQQQADPVEVNSNAALRVFKDTEALSALAAQAYGMAMGNLNPEDVADYMAIASAAARMVARQRVFDMQARQFESTPPSPPSPPVDKTPVDPADAAARPAMPFELDNVFAALENARSIAAANEPINRAEGNVAQADSEARTIVQIDEAMDILRAAVGLSTRTQKLRTLNDTLAEVNEAFGMKEGADLCEAVTAHVNACYDRAASAVLAIGGNMSAIVDRRVILDHPEFNMSKIDVYPKVVKLGDTDFIVSLVCTPVWSCDIAQLPTAIDKMVEDYVTQVAREMESGISDCATPAMIKLDIKPGQLSCCIYGYSMQKAPVQAAQTAGQLQPE